MIEPRRGALAEAIDAIRPKARGLDLAPPAPSPAPPPAAVVAPPAPVKVTAPAAPPAPVAPAPAPAEPPAFVAALTEQFASVMKELIACNTKLQIELSQANARLAEVTAKLGDIHEQQVQDSAKSDARHKKLLAAENARRAAEIASRLLGSN